MSRTVKLPIAPSSSTNLETGSDTENRRSLIAALAEIGISVFHSPSEIRQNDKPIIERVFREIKHKIKIGEEK